MLGELMIIPFAILGLATVFFIAWLIFAIIKNGDNQALSLIVPGIFSIPALVIVLCSLGLIFIAIGRAIFSYLTLSNEGLEYRLWPALKIRCTWDDVDQIKKSFLPSQGELLMLKNAEVFGLNLLWFFNKTIVGAVKTLPTVPLYQIDGWQDGNLKEELKKYAPNLFINT